MPETRHTTMRLSSTARGRLEEIKRLHGLRSLTAAVDYLCQYWADRRAEARQCNDDELNDTRTEL